MITAKPSKEGTDSKHNQLLFEQWFVDCIIHCANNYIGPDNYVWDLGNCTEWKNRYTVGMSVEDACVAEFLSN